MARFEVKTTDEMTRMINKLGADSDRIAKAMLNAAAVPLEKRVKTECAKHKRTGAMAESIKKTKAGKTKKGDAYCVVVRPTGESNTIISDDGETYQREQPVRNMEIMAHLELGTSKQAPIPILTKATADAEEECIKVMQEVYNKEVGNI